ncbi:MAG: VCBS repeat-containing protein [Planctomycetes bacterium]|nr:VCBS repeat-containing protein [Planctomycetota bacterium]
MNAARDRTTLATGSRTARAALAVLACVAALASCGDDDRGRTPSVPGDLAPTGATPSSEGAASQGATRDEASAGASGATHAAATAPDAAGWFVDATTASGLDFVHDAGLTPEKHLIETMGAGAALCDLDADGDLDAYVVQSGPIPLGDRTGAPTNRLFANDGTARFTDVTAGCGAAADDGYGMGVAAGDVDGDGDVDLLVTNVGPDVLLVQDAPLHFVDDTARAGVGDPRWTSSAAFFDADADGDLDLYVAAYLTIDLEHPLWCGRREPGWRSACHPDAYPGEPDRFYTNRGDGTFLDATESAGLVDPAAPGKGLGVIVLDADDDGRPDVYVANDSVENRMWINDGGGRFEDGTLLSGTGVNDRGLTEAGMGLALGDVDADGDDDLFVTNFDDESNTLYRHDGGGMFTDVTAMSGLDGPSRLPVGFGTVLADLDADGDLDCAVTNGHIIDNIALYHDGKTWAQHALLFTNDGSGRFRDESPRSGALCAEPHVGRGLYSGDLDGDGDLDLLATGCGERARVLLNRGAPEGVVPGGSLLLRGLPRFALVRATLADGRVLVRRAGPQPSYFGQTSGDVHLGLGTSALAVLEVTLPAGSPTADPATPSRSAFDPPLGPGRLDLAPDGRWLHSPPAPAR